MTKEEQLELFKKQFKPKEEYSFVIYIKDNEFRCYIFKRVEVISVKHNTKDIAETYETRFRNKDWQPFFQHLDKYIIKRTI